jgi:hypothetical protein
VGYFLGYFGHEVHDEPGWTGTGTGAGTSAGTGSDSVTIPVYGHLQAADIYRTYNIFIESHIYKI